MAQQVRAPLSVYMLADHLDAALAAGEDLMARGGDWRALTETPADPSDFILRQRAVAEEVRSFELMIVARILKARTHASSLAECDDRFRVIAKLFVSGTAILLDAVEESGDARATDFDTADDIVAYVRSRGLIAPDAPAIRVASDLTIDDNFLIAKRIALGPLLDMAAAFLDALDVQYELFGGDAPVTSNVRTADAEESERARLN
ncbi:hypothetical protein [Hyphomicrobium facile]|uniref:Uncharacterized protein n=1 Tax=Hyphomicrobium facile TaxID=51670 RepID=A0A1I7NFA3_9HYPH|nr:hypothetical protein [Hyphomicrobium facile]SFV33352.1 hypothetical protein SAMN04488557_1941 [Hyphomicrobium facile]